MEEWRAIEGFPGYSVSNLGNIRNDETGKTLALQRNQQGIVHVGLVVEMVQYRRTVSRLVAGAFHKPLRPTFDTPIHLNGNRSNNAASNLTWRPRWFAVKYKQQFVNGERGFIVPIVETKTGEEFENSWAAARAFGLLDKDIFLGIMNNTYVWPTYQVFKLLRK